MPNEFVNPATLFNSKKYGFSQVVVSQEGGKVFNTSGQVALNALEEIAGHDLTSQTRQALLNVKIAVEAIGGNLSDIMMIRIYYVHKPTIDTSEIGNVLREFFGTENPPASTWLGVSSLARPEFLIEIEANGVTTS